jgi:23S rRNA (cytidine1920-2'-O)/16S rRNA (cytidine1409-2'-O)-methyltransferase
MVSKELVKSRSQATDYIKRGLILVNDKEVLKPGYQVSESDLIKCIEKEHFVSRAGEKLHHALIEFDINLDGKIVMDIGSSTGGFTECSLQHGALLVYAYDVGTNQMDLELRKDARIKLFEQTNILDVDLPEVDVCLIDVSFTSILPILNHLKGFNKEIVALIKPQFEAGHNHFKGVIKDKKMYKNILNHVILEIDQMGFHIVNLKKAHIKGKKGNQEYVLHIDGSKYAHKDFREMIGEVL